MKIKVCGLRDNIREIAELPPDFMGFIFYERSPRYVGKDFVMPALPEGIQKIGVFVKASVEEVEQLARQYGLTGVQLHGNETPEFCTQVKAAGLKVIKAFAVDTAFDFEEVGEFEGKADLFLFDTKGAGYGGHGMPFDWDILSKYKGTTPFLVAGGISNENLGELLKLRHPLFAGVDINSLYETAAGVKDARAVAEAIKKVRNHEAL